MLSFRVAVAVAFLAAGLAVSCGAPGDAERRSNVVLVTVDTLRADHLGSYGYARATSPAIDWLTLNGTKFDTAIAAIPVTLPSIFSIMTSTYPIDNEVRANGYAVPASLTTMAEILRERGYATSAFVSTVILHSGHGIGRGFETYDEQFPDPFLRWHDGQRIADKTTTSAIRWLDDVADSEQPFFLWLHLIDPHALYNAPVPYRVQFDESPYDGIVTGDVDQFFDIVYGKIRLAPRDVEHMIARYDGEIAFVDAQIGRLLKRLDEHGLDDTLVVFTADHGESLGEHEYYFDHGDYVYDDLIRVPLVFRHPSLPAGREIGAQVQTVDILPTVLDFLGHEADRSAWRGRSLLPLIDGSAPELPPVAALSESNVCLEGVARPCAPLGVEGKLYSLRTESWKLITDLHGTRELFDLSADPGETFDVADHNPEVVAEMSAALDALLAGASATEQTLDEETRRRLEALGYLD